MGFGLPRVIVNERDLSFYVDTLMKGISCVAGVTERGPVAKPMLISSAQQYERIFGREIAESDFPMIAKRALSYGAVLWVSRVAHYADATDASTLTAAASSVTFKDRKAETPVDTLKVTAGYRGMLSPGTWGDSLSVKIVESELDSDNLFTVNVYSGDEIVESVIDVSMDPESEDHIEKKRSNYVVFEDLGSVTAAPLNRPALTVGDPVKLTGGNDGLTGLTDADYIGDEPAKTGMYAFDEIDDALQLAIPGVTAPAVISAGLSYCENRTDLMFLCETPFDLEPQEAVDFRMGNAPYTHATFVSNYGAIYYPKIKVYDVAQQKEKFISPLGDVLGVYAVNDWAESEAFVPAGIRRGRVLNALGVDVNVGARGRRGDGDYLCNNQINPVCVFPDSGTVVWGAQTMQRVASLLREVNVRRMLLVIKKVIAAYARVYVHQPNDPRTWREFYRGIEPRFREWKSQRWFYDYRIFCDQDAATLDEARLNIPESVQRGEFKCQTFIKPVVGIKWVILDANITRLDANFDEALSDVLNP